MELVQYIVEKPKDKSKYKVGYKKNEKLNSIPTDSYPIKCLNGIFLGKKEEDNIIVYKGIPFAKPPIKGLRWKPPVECDNSDDIYEAYSFQKNPIQIEDPGEVSSYYELGEDCLYLNIWKHNDDIKNKAVMVFIHGGGFGWGGPTDPLFEGHNYVKTHHDIILVTITYRVSILGFLDLTQIKGGENYKESANLGLLDQIQALKWVNKNIEFFGGDKNNVTIFGESAGATCVTCLPLIKGSKGLFKRIISQSGTFTWCESKNRATFLINKLKEIYKKQKKELNLNALLNLSEEEIIELNSKLNNYSSPPIRDGYILPEDGFDEMEKGAYDGIDLLIGTNADEMRYWIQESGYFWVFKIILQLILDNVTLIRIKKDGLSYYNKFKEIVKINPCENFLSDLFFRMPALKMAQIHSKKNNNVYLYYWTWPSSIPNFGACHAVEVSYVFNNLHETHYMGDKNINYKLGAIVQDMWANFAKCGDPSTKDYLWKKYNDKNNYTMTLGGKIELIDNTTIFQKERNEIMEPLVNQYIPYDYISLSFNVPTGRKIFFFIFSIAILLLGILIKLCFPLFSKLK